MVANGDAHPDDAIKVPGFLRKGDGDAILVVLAITLGIAMILIIKLQMVNCRQDGIEFGGIFSCQS